MDQPSRPLVYVVDTTYDNRFGERKGWLQHDSRPNEPVHFGEEFRVNFQRACCRYRPQSYDARHVTCHRRWRCSLEPYSIAVAPISKLGVGPSYPGY